MQIVLEVMAGSQEGQMIALPDSEFVIGRAADCALRPASTAVSRRHCVVWAHEGQARILDLNSRGGTFVNGARIAAQTELHDGDRLQVGPLAFQVHLAVELREVPAVEDNAVADLLLEMDPPEAPATSETVVEEMRTPETLIEGPGPQAPYRPERPPQPEGNPTEAALKLLREYRRRQRERKNAAKE